MRSPVDVLPQEFLARLQRIVPSDSWPEVAHSFNRPRPHTFRVNTLRAAIDEVRREIEDAGFGVEPVSWLPGAFILRRGELRQLQATPAYREGRLYVQTLSSMVPALVLDPQPGETVLDLTAAPGSKTTQIAALMQGRGRIVANDNNRIRLYKLKANLISQGAANVDVSMRHGESFGKKYPAQFDRVLVDAPCTTEGRFYLPKPTSYRYWTLHKVHAMAHKQKKLLTSGLQAVKSGGVLVYSTCTFGPEENEAIVSGALEQFGASVTLEPIALPIPNVMPGLPSWHEQAYHPDIRQTVRILPTTLMEGFFLAKFRKGA